MNSPLWINMGSSQCYHSQNRQVPYLHRGNLTGNYVSLWISGSLKPWLQMIILIKIHPTSTLSDAAQHLAGKSLFCKLDCSQVYHCLQMADQRSVKMLAFNFASRTFAYKRLAQGPSRYVSAFSSFMREYLDQLLKQINVLNTWTILESQPTMLRTLPGTFGQSSSAFAM